jgi:outer membrane protein insertion porin family
MHIYKASNKASDKARHQGTQQGAHQVSNSARTSLQRKKLSLVIAALFVQAFAVDVAMAFTPFVVKDIRVEGVQRTEPGTVFGYLPVKVGDRMTDEKAAEAVKALFATGFFKDVRVEVDKDVLVIYLEERPAIATVDVTGSKDIEKDTLRKAIREIGIVEARLFDRAQVEKAEQEIKRQYLARGRYGVKVTTTVTPLERNRVGLSFAIEEGDIAKIAGIRFVGNKAFSDSQLLGQLRSSSPTWLSWYTKSDQYSREKLGADLETLRSFYQDRGYLEFAVESTQVSISPDKESVDIVLGINEGEQYTLKDMRLSGELLGKGDELIALSTMRKGQTFSAADLNATTKALTDRLGTLGYAFSSINAVPEIDKEKREVVFNFLIDPGRRAYVRRINITGNDKTRDEVIRRELRQYEDSWYDGEKIRLSKDRVNRLGYFKSVEIESTPVADAPDQVDLNVAVSERNTGNFTVGIGFGSTEKVILTAAINQTNFLGTGNALNAEINTSRIYRTIFVSHTNPYYTADGISRTFDFYTRLTNASALNLGEYKLRSNGLGVRFGIPYAETDRWFAGISVENTQIDAAVDRSVGAVAPPATSLVPGRIWTHVRDFGTSSTGFLGNLGWRRDSRDSAFTPSKGALSSASLEFTLPVGDFRYAKLGLNHQRYIPLAKNYTLALNLDIGIGQAIGGSNKYPFFKNYYAGGIGSVRGFEPSSLGAREVSGTGTVPIGGRSKFLASAEYVFPLPGTGNEGLVRSFLFVDAGNVFPGTSINFADLRYSTGIGLNWASPIGPMKISFGVPLNRQINDRTQKIQFQIGTGF